MSWRRRIFELAAAGGTLAACDGTPRTSFCGNVNPDPCICDRTPLDAGQCVAEAVCRDAGGTWVFPGGFMSTPPGPDAAAGYEGYCAPLGYQPPDALPRLIDAAPDAPPTDAPTD